MKIRALSVAILLLIGLCLATACADNMPEASEAVTQVEQAESEQPSEGAASALSDFSVGGRVVSEACEGMSTEIIQVSADSFAVDDRLVRVLIAPSRECTSVLTLTPTSRPSPDARCVVTHKGPRSVPISYVLMQGECYWLEAQTIPSFGSSPSGAPGCFGVDSLELTVNAENFNETGRVDAVAFVPESRCYVFISAMQDPERAEPFQFGPDEQCVIRHGRTPQGTCEAISFWTGRGRGGIATKAEAKAMVSLVGSPW